MAKAWSKEEDALIVELYRNQGKKISQISQILKNRTMHAVNYRLSILGVSRNSCEKWQKKEINILIKKFPFYKKEQIIAALPNRTYMAIKAMAKTLGINRVIKIRRGRDLSDRIKGCPIDKYIIENYSNSTCSQIARDIKTSRQRVWARIKVLKENKLIK